MSASREQLEGALRSHGIPYKPTRTGLTFQCTVHDDHHPSVDAKHNGRDRMLVLCRVCGPAATPDIISRIGLGMPDLYDEKPTRSLPVQRPRQARPVKVAEYPYPDENGVVLMTQQRWEPGWNGKAKSFSTVDANGNKGVEGIRRVPYNLPRILAEARAGGLVAIAEGEKNVDSILRAGGVATCNLGGSGGEWTDEFSSFLVGCSEVVVIADKDAAGRKHAAKIMASLRRVGVPARAVEAAVGNDATDHLDAGKSFADFIPVDLGDSDSTAKSDESVSSAGIAANSGNSGTSSGAPGWENPVPVDRVPLLPFPTQRLGSLGKYVEAAAECLQVPVDLVAFATLATISTATGGRRKVLVKQRWTEITALWMAGFAESSARKTPALDAAAGPLRDIETELIDGATNHVEAAAQEIRILTAQMKKAEERIADGGKPRRGGSGPNPTVEELKAEAESYRMRLAELGDGPKVPQILVRDATLEAIGRVMGDQNGRIGTLASEGGLFKVAAGMYSKNGQANTDLLLEAYSGGPYTIDRVSRAGHRMPSTFLSLGLIVQPGIVAGIERKNPEFRQNGMLGRFLFCMPQDVDEDSFDTPDIPEHLEAEYQARLRAVVTKVWNTPSVVTMQLDDEARAVFAAFYNDFGRRRKPGGDLHSIADWAGKFRGNVIRIAACLTLYEDPTATAINAQTITDCIALTDYFVAHAKAVFDLMGEDPESNVTPMRDVLAWLRGRTDPLADASIRDVWQGVKGRSWARDAEKVHAVIEELSDLGWIDIYPPDPELAHRRGRKPSPTFAVHPLVAVKPKR
ncbi:DUF3987 domain-containing protein [Kitasatospora terrestris]|uniref:Toprim domain-containing protein n=1 Tax=Kitasatospora terrestris TaxID=258051 RepID=A0ABP9E304_9ACTN